MLYGLVVQYVCTQFDLPEGLLWDLLALYTLSLIPGHSAYFAPAVLGSPNIMYVYFHQKCLYCP